MGDFDRWLSVNHVRKQQPMRRQTVLAVMLSGQLPYEQQGRIRYARACDVDLCEESRLMRTYPVTTRKIRPDLLDLAFGRSSDHNARRSGRRASCAAAGSRPGGDAFVMRD